MRARVTVLAAAKESHGSSGIGSNLNVDAGITKMVVIIIAFWSIDTFVDCELHL